MQHPIMRALSAKGISVRDAATRLNVDPKTIQRWCAGRIPYRVNRAALSRLTGWSEHDLWPGVIACPSSGPESRAAKLAYPNLSAISSAEWQMFFGRAKRQIDMLHWASLATEGSDLARICRETQASVKHRILLGDPESHGGRPTDTLIVYDGVNLRISRIPEYSAIYRADNQLLISPLIFGCPPGRSPVVQVSLDSDQELASPYLEIFQQSWLRAYKI